MEEKKIDEILNSIQQRRVDYNINDKLFIQKIHHGDMKYLRDNYQYISSKSKQNIIFLFTCCITDDILILDFIINIFAIDVHLQSRFKRNCLMFACHYNINLCVIKHLIEHYLIDINQNNNNNNNCLTIACKYNPNWRIIDYLLNQIKMDINHLTKRKNNCLTVACTRNTLEIIQYLIGHKDGKTLLDHVTLTNKNCLMYACQFNKLDCVKYLIEENLIDPHTVLNNETCLRCAYLNDDPLIAKYLIDHTNLFDHHTNNLRGIGFDKFKNIAILIKNYGKLNKFLKMGLARYTLREIKNFIDSSLNPLILNNETNRLYNIHDPFKEIDFNRFKQHVDCLDNETLTSMSFYNDGVLNRHYSIINPVAEPEVGPESEVVRANPTRDPDEIIITKQEIATLIDFSKNELLFEHNNIRYHGDRDVVYDSIIFLKDINSICDFTDDIVLEGVMPKYAVNLYIQTIYGRPFDINEIKIPDIFNFIRFIDQYPSTQLSIDLFERFIVRYFNDNNIEYNDMMKDIALKYKLRILYLHIHIKSAEKISVDKC